MEHRYRNLIEELNYDCSRACKTAEPCEECASCRAAQEFARLLRFLVPLRLAFDKALVEEVRAYGGIPSYACTPSQIALREALAVLLQDELSPVPA